MKIKVKMKTKMKSIDKIELKKYENEDEMFDAV